MDQAISWAVEANADIISISGAFFKADTLLEDAISEAMKAGVVVIASTAGEGYRKGKEVYPANYESVMRIAAADWWGRETPESVLENADYILPGDHIVVKTGFLGSDMVPQEVSGTSVATAIAAGIASLILSCHRMALSTQDGESEWKYHKEHKRAIVRVFFDKMVSEGKFVKPWEVFGGRNGQKTWGGADSVLGWIRTKFLKGMFFFAEMIIGFSNIFTAA